MRSGLVGLVQVKYSCHSFLLLQGHIQIPRFALYLNAENHGAFAFKNSRLIPANDFALVKDCTLDEILTSFKDALQILLVRSRDKLVRDGSEGEL